MLPVVKLDNLYAKKYFHPTCELNNPITPESFNMWHLHSKCQICRKMIQLAFKYYLKFELTKPFEIFVQQY